MRSPIMIGAGVLGWVLFGVSVWYQHRPLPPESIPPKVQEQLAAHGFEEATVSKAPPASVLADTPKIDGTERLASFSGSAMPTGQRPTVQTSAQCPGSVFPPSSEVAKLQPAPNWTLAPENLGIETWTLDVRKTGRRAWYAFKATVIAQAPDGDVRRTIKPDEGDTKGWVSSSALGIPPRFGPYLHATTQPTFEGGVYWTKGRVQYDAGVGFDFDRQRWFGGGGARF